MNLSLATVSYVVNPDQTGFYVGVLVLRVVTALTVAAHGYNKFFGGGKIAGTARWFASMGMRPNGTIHAYMAACTELGASFLLAIGLGTPLAAAGIVGVMVVAAWTHRENGFFVFKDGWEYNSLIAFVVVAIACMGPGRWSLDWVLQIDAVFQWKTAVAVAAGLGLAAPIALLAACYRPPAKDDAQ